MGSNKVSSAAGRTTRQEAPSQEPLARTGRLVGFHEDGRVLVKIRGLREPLPARRLLRLDRAFRRAVLDRREVMLLFEEGDPGRPIIAGVLNPDAGGPEASDAARRVEHPVAPSIVIEADADGRRVKLVALDEIVLECGGASITLRRNGRVIIRGTEVDSRAAGAHRIRGGQIRLN